MEGTRRALVLGLVLIAGTDVLFLAYLCTLEIICGATEEHGFISIMTITKSI